MVNIGNSKFTFLANTELNKIFLLNIQIQIQNSMLKYEINGLSSWI